MNNKQESRLSMYMIVREYLTINIAKTGSLPNFAGLFAKHKNLIEQIHEQSTVQAKGLRGVAIAKNQIREKLVKEAEDIAKKIYAYASEVGNTTLEEEVNVTQTSLRRSSDVELPKKSKLIRDRANTHLNDVKGYGLTSGAIQTLGETIARFEEVNPEPKMGIENKKEATTEIRNLFVSADANLKKMDVLMETVKNTDAPFYREYRDVRKIVNTAVRRVHVIGTVSESGTGLKLDGVEIGISAREGTEKLKGEKGSGVVKKVTGKSGRFQVKSMAEGSYEVSAEKAGYKSVKVVMNVIRGSVTRVEIKLERE